MAGSNVSGPNINLDFLSRNGGGGFSSPLLQTGSMKPNVPYGGIDLSTFGGASQANGALGVPYKMDTGFSNMSPGSVPGADTTEGGFNFLGEDGWGNLALGGINAGIQGYMGYKQLGLAKDQLDFQKKAFEKNYNAQKQRTNTQLRDRQKRRYTENPGHYVSPDEYMSQNGVK